MEKPGIVSHLSNRSTIKKLFQVFVSELRVGSVRSTSVPTLWRFHHQLERFIVLCTYKGLKMNKLNKGVVCAKSMEVLKRLMASINVFP
jgi:hypothetical protein